MTAAPFMMASAAALDALRQRRPEWAPWLAVVEEILREIGAPLWDEAVPRDAPAARPAAPLLAGATLALPAKPVRRLLDRLLRVASRTGTPAMATLQHVRSPDDEALRWLEASLCQDRDRLAAAARAAGADTEAFQAVLALLPMPLLQACSRRWTPAIAESWIEGYCPVCGAWPAFAEVRGIERSRYFRCGRCGGAWHARALHCPYCDTHDHDELVALVPAPDGSNVSNAAIDACKRCLGYVKALTRLQGCAPELVMVEDLATVDLDVAALDHGFKRPAVAGYALDATVTARPAGRLFAWKS